MRALVLVIALSSLPVIYAVQTRQRTTRQSPVLKEARPAPPGVEAKLAQRIAFAPSGESSPLEQLVEVATHYRIPMGIEWEGADKADAVAPLPSAESGATVRDLLNAILSRSPKHYLIEGDGVVHVASSGFASHPRNFLNVVIDEFRLKGGNLFDAEHELRRAVDETLHPEEYEGGYAGGHGYAPDHPFVRTAVTYKGQNVTVREILNGLVKSSGDALWIVRSEDVKAEEAGGRPGQAATPEAGPTAKARYPWKLIPLSPYTRESK